jgi:hypothetical protein
MYRSCSMLFTKIVICHINRGLISEPPCKPFHGFCKCICLGQNLLGFFAHLIDLELWENCLTPRNWKILNKWGHHVAYISQWESCPTALSSCSYCLASRWEALWRQGSFQCPKSLAELMAHSGCSAHAWRIYWYAAVGERRNEGLSIWLREISRCGFLFPYTHMNWAKWDITARIKISQSEKQH